ncbi:hypothetical protein AV530_011970 [Patagioenas fasciata monilis]|uniref:Uncharacterized protein n=1 Tax=Patagioenas fasciata monilis TaxID=372326 RepID=A0A1V4JUE3_PATFA|nr:hypothetical protein AV530_011970 [Patagioenas fasciata monilis]
MVELLSERVMYHYISCSVTEERVYVQLPKLCSVVLPKYVAQQCQHIMESMKNRKKTSKKLSGLERKEGQDSESEPTFYRIETPVLFQ